MTSLATRLDLGFAVGAHGDIGQITGVGTGGVFQAVLLAEGIKVAPGADKIRRGTHAFGMDVEGVYAGRQILHRHDDFYPLGSLGQSRLPHLLPLGIDQGCFGRGRRALAAAVNQRQG